MKQLQAPFAALLIQQQLPEQLNVELARRHYERLTQQRWQPCRKPPTWYWNLIASNG